MATKPTFVSYTQSTRNVTTTPRTSGSIAVAVGDRVAVFAIGENEGAAFGTPTSSGITFAPSQSDGATGYTEVGSWTGTVTSGSSINVSISNSGSAVTWGFEVWVFRNSDGFGASNKGQGSSGGPSIANVNTGANSANIYIGGDWNAGATTGKTWRTVNSITPTSGNGLEKLASQVGSNYTIYSGYWDDAGAAGSKTLGMSAPSQRWNGITLEILGTTASSTTADAELGTAAFAAYAPTVATTLAVDAGLATVGFTAYAPTVTTEVATTADAGLAAVGFTAYAPTVETTLAVSVEAATIGLAALAPDVSTVSTDAPAGLAAAAFAAYAPTVTLAAVPPAGLATVGFTAYAPTVVTETFDPDDPNLTLPIPVRSELLLGGVWVDTTDRTYTRQAIEITRGIPDEGTRADPTAAVFQLNNRDGRFSLRNPLSPYAGQIGRNTPARIVLDVADDDFNRTTSGGWGTATSRHDWTVGGNGQTAQYSTTASTGRIAVNTEASTYLIAMAVDAADLEVSCVFKPGVVATGDAYVMELFARRSGSAYYGARLSMGIGGMISLSICQEPGVEILIDAGEVLAYGTATEVGVRFKIADRVMAAKVWNVADGEPVAWTLHAADPEEDANLDAGDVGVAMYVPTSSTLSMPRTFTFSRWDVVHYRAAVELSAPPTRWDVSGQDVWMAASGAGISRRLGQGTVLASALTRANAGLANLAYETGMDPLVPLDHWPMEDDAPGGAWANVVPGGSSMIVSAFGAEFGSAPVLGGSGPLAKFPASGYAIGRIRGHDDVGVWSATAVCYIDPAMIDRVCPIAIDTAPVDVSTDLVAMRVHIDFNDAQIQLLEKAGGVLSVTSYQNLTATDIAQLRGNWVYVALVADNTDTATVKVFWYVEGVEHLITIFVGMANAYAPGRTFSTGSSLDGTETSFGHAAFYLGDVTQYATTNFDPAALHGFVGEPSAERVRRLCREEQIAITMVAHEGDSMPMGAQKPGKLLDLLDQCAESDMGLLYEPRDELAFVYVSRRMRYNIDVTLPLTYSARGHVAPPIDPLPDDFQVVNDLTVTRIDGGSARYVLTEGPLSTAPPPEGVGSYSNQRSLSLGGDDLAAGRASFEVFISTHDEERYPTIHVDMVAAIAAGEGDLIAAAKRLDSGNRLTISDMPAWQPPGDVDQIVLGFRETIGDGGQAGYAWDIEVQTRPYGPWGHIGIMRALADTPDPDEPGARMDTAGSRTSGSFIAGTNTSLTVVTYAGPIWGVTADPRMDFPFDIVVSGIILRVTAISGSSSPQTFTVSTTLPQGSQFAMTLVSGSPVRLAYPARWGL